MHLIQVCALDVGADGTIISGSWDKSDRFLDNADDSTARVWKNWECVYTLKGHERAVWAVLALPNDEYLTGCFYLFNLIIASADKTIGYWQGDKLIRTLRKHTDVVRGLCEIPGLGFASCGNDAYAFLKSI